MKSKTQGVYRIKNTVNGKVYIGSSRCIEDRIASHKSDLRNGRASSKMQKDFNQFGLEVFEFKILRRVGNAKDLIKTEEIYIKRYSSVVTGYNTAKPINSRCRIIKIQSNESEYQDIMNWVKENSNEDKNFLLNTIKNAMKKQ